MNNITVTCLGHGGAFADVDQGNSAYLFEYGNHRILLDCGSTVPTVLNEMDIDPGSLTGVVISHLHQDHCGGLERLLYHRRFISKADPIIMGMRTLHNWVTAMRAFGNGLDSPDYVLRDNDTDGLPLSSIREDSGQYIDQLDTIYFKSYHACHGSALPSMNCCSFRLDVVLDSGHRKKVFFSGDRTWHATDHTTSLAMEESDLVLHELELGRNSGTHTHYSDLSEVPAHALARFRFHHHGADIDTCESLKEKGLHLLRKGDFIHL